MTALSTDQMKLLIRYFMKILELPLLPPKALSNAKSTHGKIDMICAMKNGDNFAVITKLLSGKQKGKYRKWLTDSEGMIQKSITKSEEQALSEGWELLFNVDLDQDDLIGSDQDQNGLADELVNTSYYLFNNGKPIQVTTKQGAVQSHIPLGTGMPW